MTKETEKSFEQSTGEIAGKAKDASGDAFKPSVAPVTTTEAYQNFAAQRDARIMSRHGSSVSSARPVNILARYL